MEQNSVNVKPYSCQKDPPVDICVSEKREISVGDVGTINKPDVSENAATLWEKMLDILSIQVNNKEGFATWLAPTRGVSFDNNILKVEVPNPFFIEWIGQYYLSAIEEAGQKVMNNELEVVFCTKDAKGNSLTAVVPRRSIRGQPDVSKLQERYTFDSFVVGECNRFACAASKAVAEAPAEAYNPLLIYGGVGLGKTHLLHAIGNHAKKLKTNLRVYYTPAENLFIELIQAIERGNTLEFKNKYRSQDMLLIDDVHYLIGKERLQEEIFHIFNNLHGAGKQVAFTSDRPPYEIPTLEERLASRLQAGLVVDLQPPDLETRMAILRKKAEKEGYELNQDLTYLIASRVKSNVRSLEGCLIRLMAVSSIEGKEITPEQAEKALNAIVPKTDFITTDKILEKITEEFKLRLTELKSGVRTKNIALARQVAMYLMRKMLGYSLKEVGIHFGGKDHTTVLHACKKIELLRTQNQEFDECIRRLVVGISGV
jgi:chromosomal replication initiator protein